MVFSTNVSNTVEYFASYLLFYLSPHLLHNLLPLNLEKALPFTISGYTVPDDFVSTSGTLLLTQYSTVQCVNISIQNDNEDEQDQECFVVTISTSDDEDVVLSTASATLCIIDDDGRLALYVQTLHHKLTVPAPTCLYNIHVRMHGVNRVDSEVVKSHC